MRAALRGLPVAMSYNVTVVDGAGRTLTAYLGPGRARGVHPLPLATNHRGDVPEFAETARSLHSVERRATLLGMTGWSPDPAEMVHAFLSEPLYNSGFSRAFGTLYTALYQPAAGYVDYCWPGRTWRRHFDDPDGTTEITFHKAERARIR